MEKYIKFTLITLFLISSFKYSNTAACDASSITKNDCTANSTCEWTATPCKGSDACKTAANYAAQATCEAASTGCTYAGSGSSATCKTANNDACANGFTSQDTCQKCQFTVTGGACSVKSSSSNNDSGKSSNSDSDDDKDFGSCLKFSGLIGLLSLLF